MLSCSQSAFLRTHFRHPKSALAPKRIFVCILVAFCIRLVFFVAPLCSLLATLVLLFDIRLASFYFILSLLLTCHRFAALRLHSSISRASAFELFSNIYLFLGKGSASSVGPPSRMNRCVWQLRLQICFCMLLAAPLNPAFWFNNPVASRGAKVFWQPPSPRLSAHSPGAFRKGFSVDPFEPIYEPIFIDVGS